MLMPLSRQLGLSLLIVLCCVFIGTLWINVNNTRDFIAQQLASHSQDTATSLGLSIAPYLGNDEDVPIVDTMMNAIFDRGYYLSMILKDLDGQSILEKSNPEQLDTVPDWFISMFPLSPPVSQTEINTGWNIAGTLSVVSHPGTGYQQLWNNAKQSLSMIAAVFILAILLVFLLVKIITTPILAVVEQAKAISQRKFDLVEKIPRTPELRDFVMALNSMSAILSKMFEQLTDQAQRYRQFAYTDGLTGVGNRRAFTLALDNVLADAELQASGYLLLVRLSSLAQVNKEFGAASGDAYITCVCNILNNQACTPDTELSVFRVNGADFALLLEDTDPQHCQQLASLFVKHFGDIEKSEFSMGTAHVGISRFSYGDKKEWVLEQADSALASAELMEQKWQVASNLVIIQSNSAWRDQLLSLVEDGRVDFVAQPINNWSNDTVYNEWFGRFSLPGASEHIPMAQLVPASIRLDYAQQLDEMVIRTALKELKNTSHDIGLNLSHTSLANSKFCKWLLDTLPCDKSLCSRLVIEIPERALVNKISGLEKWVIALKLKGVRITVERFGAQLAAVTHLRKIRPEFLKIDGRFTRNINKEPDNQLFVQSLVNIAHGLNIKVIAEVVETKEEAQCLQKLFVDYIQGYYICSPKPLKPSS
jgi:diguanylate cyclase (GGDEF)-like protein